MEYRALGGTGVQADHAESVRMIRTGLDGGVNFVDTADVYSHGESEEIVGKALKGRRDRTSPALAAGARRR